MTLVERITDPSLYNIAVFYSKSLATRLIESRVDTFLRQLDSMRVYWTTLFLPRLQNSRIFCGRGRPSGLERV